MYEIFKTGFFLIVLSVAGIYWTKYHFHSAPNTGSTSTGKPVVVSSPSIPATTVSTAPAMKGEETKSNKTVPKKTPLLPDEQRYQKIDFDGSPVDQKANQWGCILDRNTNLIWEVKAFDAGLRDQDNTYTWYDDEAEVNGVTDGGKCFYSACDTQAFIAAVNKNTLCGANDWRLPTADELSTLIDHDFHDPTINTQYFPHTASSFYLTSSEFANNPDLTMSITFFSGVSHGTRKNLGYHVRLVRQAR